jgi:DNA adenine methylase
MPLAEAVAQHAAKLRLGTVTRWIAQWRQEGLLGLVDRRAGPPAVAPRQLSLDFPRTRTAPRTTAGRRSRGRPALPLVKWSGSKAAMAAQLAALVPSRFVTYHEPFVGGGAVFFALQPACSFLSDLNAELVNVYAVVKQQLEPLLAALAQHQNTREHFLAVRGVHPDTLPPVERAARTLFLNRTCFNGLFRVNRAGLFNVPYGSQQHTTFFQPDSLRRAHLALQSAGLACRDFATCADQARRGDFVYLDPPYVSGLRGDQGFVSYQADGFDEADAERVAQLFEQLDRQGSMVMLSNPDTAVTRARYRGFRIESLSVRRQVGGHADRRGRAREIVVRNYQR